MRVWHQFPPLTCCLPASLPHPRPSTIHPELHRSLQQKHQHQQQQQRRQRRVLRRSQQVGLRLQLLEARKTREARSCLLGWWHGRLMLRRASAALCFWKKEGRIMEGLACWKKIFLFIKQRHKQNETDRGSGTGSIFNVDFALQSWTATIANSAFEVRAAR